MASVVEQVRQVEERAANALPAAVTQQLDGWLLRFTDGVTRRANSVWPNAGGEREPLEARLALVEEFYARWGVPARYQLCPAACPADLDDRLAERGYVTEARTCVQVAELAQVLDGARAPVSPRVTVAETMPEAWFAAYCEAEEVSERAAAARRGILARIAPRTGYAFLEAEGRTVAVGLGVVERGWLGLFNMSTHPDFRRRGAATEILRALCEWGRMHGAEAGYLQVMEENAPASRLYGQVGFRTLYHYHYRTRSTG
jgi:ribosomal protein S18 acetylase RimI-like enzyme